MLPFGLRSTLIIFMAVADALQWIMEKEGVSPVFHYLDDFTTLGPPRSPQCQWNIQGIRQVCRSTCTPLEEDKCEGASPVMTFLGMQLDSQKLEIRLPADKLERLQQLLSDWKSWKAGKKRDLLSLIGYLQHASKAVHQGRSFLWWLITLSTAVNN